MRKVILMSLLVILLSACSGALPSVSDVQEQVGEAIGVPQTVTEETPAPIVLANEVSYKLTLAQAGDKPMSVRLDMNGGVDDAKMANLKIVVLTEGGEIELKISPLNGVSSSLVPGIKLTEVISIKVESYIVVEHTDPPSGSRVWTLSPNELK